MPKSRRDKAVSLTKTKKKAGRASKERLMADVRACLATYGGVYVFEVEAMRNVKFKELREEWGGSRFFLGKNRVMQIALGRDPHDEHKDAISKLAPYLTGQRGLLFTDTSKDDVLSYFSLFRDDHFARSGCIASADFALEKGPLPSDVAPHPLEPTLRKLGLPTRLVASVVELQQDAVVCRAGDVLTPEQCRLLQLFGVRQAAFRIHLIAAHFTDPGGRGRLELFREGASTRLDKEAAAAATAPGSGRPRQRRRKPAAAAGRERDEDEDGDEDEGKEDEDAGADAEDAEDDDEDESDEFVPGPLENWGEIAVPSYGH